MDTAEHHSAEDDGYTTLAFLGDKAITLDDAYPAGERVRVREDFDDLHSPVVGDYELAREGDRWVLR